MRPKCVHYSRIVPNLNAAGIDVNKYLWTFCVTWAALVIFIADYPPLIDLPQHAGQIRLLIDYLQGDFNQGSTFTVNFFTPYLLGYSIAAVLGLLLPVIVSIKVVLACGFIAYILALVKLRAEFDGDPRLDWLFIPSYFGFSWHWGLMTFVLSAALGIIFLLYAYRYSQKASLKLALTLLLVGILLFFSHGLMFIFCVFIGAVMILKSHRLTFKNYLIYWPFLVLFSLCLSYSFYIYTIELQYPSEPQAVAWRYSIKRFFNIINYITGSVSGTDSGADTIIFWPYTLLLFTLPYLLTCKIRDNFDTRVIPFIIVMLSVYFLPMYGLKTAFLYQRFTLFILPFYALCFYRDNTALVATTNNLALAESIGATTSGTSSRVSVSICLVALLTLFFLSTISKRLYDFNAESADFVQLLKRVPEHKKLLSIVYEKQSEAAANSLAYTHFGAWYQALHGGVAYTNHAIYVPQIFRFNVNAIPTGLNFINWNPELFNVNEAHLEHYDLILIRQLTAPVLVNKYCQLNLSDHVGKWYLYDISNCQH